MLSDPSPNKDPTSRLVGRNDLLDLHSFTHTCVAV